MNPLFSGAAVLLATAQLALPSRLIFLPLLVATCHLPNVSFFSLAGFDFSITRLLICLGLMRAVVSRRLVWSPRNGLDMALLVWACIALGSSIGHGSEDGNPLVARMGLVYNVAGAYLYARAYVRDHEGVLLFVKCLVVTICVLAVMLVVENVTHRNLYAVFGGVNPVAFLREGKIRSMGPFAHPILTGTAGATSFALALALSSTDRRWARLGAVGCVLTTLCSSSSGPLASLFLAVVVQTGLWRWRANLSQVRWTVLALLVGLQLVMKAPVWYLMARIDIVGGSTGWHRAELITAGMRHLNEWWLLGTDRTVHWMPTGVSWSPNHTDITNHYLMMGVTGGLPLLLSFVGILIVSFVAVGRQMARLRTEGAVSSEYTCWSVGCALFTHSVTFLSVSYFDQVNVLFCLLVGAIPGLCANPSADDPMQAELPITRLVA